MLAAVCGQAWGRRAAACALCWDCSRRAGHCLSAFDEYGISPQRCRPSGLQRWRDDPVRMGGHHHATRLPAVACSHLACHYCGGIGRTPADQGLAILARFAMSDGHAAASWMWLSSDCIEVDYLGREASDEDKSAQDGLQGEQHKRDGGPFDEHL